MPGEGNVKPFKTSGYDWAVATGVVSYSPSHYFNFQLGNGKNSWGDGYRSLLLSDCATAYPFFKITTDFWRLKYVNLWAQLTDLRSPITSQQLQAHGYNKKWASLHYLSWNALSWVNLSFFEGVVWEHSSEQGYRGFDVQYANPIVFYRPVESQNGSPDNMLMGGSAKVTILKRHVLYGQVIIDEFSLSHMKARDGWWANKYGIQAGVKVFDLFTLKHLDLQAEYNRVRPFTYSHWTSLQSYGHYNQPLAHPLGANFQELVTISRYTIKRFFVDLKVVMARYGTDLPGQNVGHDIFEAYSVKRKELGNTLGQGLSNKLLQTDVCLSWLVNPVSNLNLAVGYTTRDYLVGDKRTVRSLLYFAVRTSLGNTSIDY
jgi:hypothetical protein